MPGSLHVRGGQADMTLHLIVRGISRAAGRDYLTGLTLDQELLKTMIKPDGFSHADAIELRDAFMQGILFEVQDRQLHLVATDSGRLAVRRASAPDLPPLRVWVPARALRELARFLPFEGGGSRDRGGGQSNSHEGGRGGFLPTVRGGLPRLSDAAPEGICLPKWW